MAGEYAMLPNGCTFDPGQTQLQPSGLCLPEAVFRMATVTLYEGNERRKPRLVPCNATLGDLMGGDGKHLLYRDISKPHENATFVVQRRNHKMVISYCKLDEAGSSSLISTIVRDDVTGHTKLRDLGVEPCTEVFVVSDDVSKIKDHPILQKHEPWIVVKLCPHVADSADDTKFLRIPRSSTTATDVLHHLTQAHIDVKYHFLRADDHDTFIPVLDFCELPSNILNLTVRQSCGFQDCHKIVKAALLVKDNGIHDHDYVKQTVKELGEFQDNDDDIPQTISRAFQKLLGQEPERTLPLKRCASCWPIVMSQALRNLSLKIQGSRVCITESYRGADAVVMATFVKGRVFHAYAYEIRGDEVKGPRAELQIGPGGSGRFKTYSGQDIPIHLLNDSGEVEYVMERFWTKRKRFVDVDLHDCNLECINDQVVKRAASARTEIVRRTTPSRTESRASAARIEEDDTPTATQDGDTRRIAAFFQNQPHQDDGGPFAAEQATVTFYVSHNQCTGPGAPIDIEINTSDEVVTAFLRDILPKLWGDTGEPRTYDKRNCAGGCWGVLIQKKDSRLEIVVALPHRTVGRRRLQVVVPQIGFRLTGQDDFKVLDHNVVGKVRVGLLGLHLDSTTATLFRFLQKNNDDFKPWIEVIMDVQTSLEREIPKKKQQDRKKYNLRPRLHQMPKVKIIQPFDDRPPGRAAAAAAASSSSAAAAAAAAAAAVKEPARPSTKARGKRQYEQGSAEEKAAKRQAIETNAPATNFTELVAGWEGVLRGRLLADILSTDVDAKQVREMGRNLMRLVVNETFNEYLAHHLLHPALCILLSYLPESHLAKWDKIASEWRARRPRALAWGQFRMEFVPLDDQGYDDDNVDMQVWKVKVPTEQQLKDMDADKQLELLARLLGFGVWYVNFISSSSIRNYPNALRCVFPWVHLQRSKRAVFMGDVLRKNQETKPHKEMHQYPRRIFQKLLDMIVSRKRIVQRGIRPREGDGLLDVCRFTTQFLGRMADEIAHRTDRFLYQPILDTDATIFSIRNLVQRRHGPVQLSGLSGTGKSTTESFLDNTVWNLKPTAAAAAATATSSSTDMELLASLSTKPVTTQDLEKHALAFGRVLADTLRSDQGEINDTLFRSTGKDTSKLVGIGREQTFGASNNSSSHVQVIRHNNTSIPPDEMHITFWPLDKILHVAEAAAKKGDDNMKKWVAANRVLVEHLAGKTLRIKIPLDPEGNEAVNRGCFEAICNFIHGVHHGLNPLGSKDMRVAHPGLMQRIEIARQLCTICPGICDRIGDGEPKLDIVNAPGLKSLLSIVVVTEFITPHIQAVEKAMDETPQVLVLYNYAQSNRGNANEYHKAPLAVAQQAHEPTAVEMETLFRNARWFDGDRVAFVHGDVVSGGAMLFALGQQTLELECLHRLAMSWRCCNLGGVVAAIHEGYIKAYVVPILESIEALEGDKQVIDHWAMQQYPELIPELASGLADLEAGAIARVALDLAFYGDQTVHAMRLSGDARQYTNADCRQDMAPVDFKNLTVFEYEEMGKAVDNMQKAAEKIDKLAFEAQSTGIRNHTWSIAKRVMNLLDAQQHADDDQTLQSCIHLRKVLATSLVKDCISCRQQPGEAATVTVVHAHKLEPLARELRKRCTKAAYDFFHLSWRSIPGLQVEVAASAFEPIAPAAWSGPLKPLLRKLVKIDKAFFRKRQLQGDELDNAKTTLWCYTEMFFDLVVQQVCNAALHVQSSTLPSAELLEDSLLHVLQGSSMSQAFKDNKVVAHLQDMMQKALKQVFTTTARDTTMVAFNQGFHPGKEVTNRGKGVRGERLEIAKGVTDYLGPLKAAIERDVEDVAYSPHLVKLFAKMAESVFHFRRVRVLPNAHLSFSNYVIPGGWKDADDAWVGALRVQMAPGRQEMDEDERRRLIEREVLKRYTNSISDFQYEIVDFGNAREALAYLLGYGGMQAMSKAEFVEKQSATLDPAVRQALASLPDYWDAQYAKYEQEQAEHKMDVAHIVMKMGKITANFFPIDKAYVYPQGEHPGLYYLPNSNEELLDAHACIDKNGQLKSMEDLGVTPDIYDALQRCNLDKASICKVLEDHDSKDANAIRYEYQMASVTRKRSIAVLLHLPEPGGSGGTFKEHVFHPRLPIRVPQIVKETTGGFDDEDRMRYHSFVKEHKAGRLDVVVAVDGRFYVLSAAAGAAAADEDENEDEEIHADASVMDSAFGQGPSGQHGQGLLHHHESHDSMMDFAAGVLDIDNGQGHGNDHNTHQQGPPSLFQGHFEMLSSDNELDGILDYFKANEEDADWLADMLL